MEPGETAERQGIADPSSLAELRRMLEDESGQLLKGVEWALERLRRVLE